MTITKEEALRSLETLRIHPSHIDANKVEQFISQTQSNVTSEVEEMIEKLYSHCFVYNTTERDIINYKNNIKSHISQLTQENAEYKSREDRIREVVMNYFKDIDIDANIALRSLKSILEQESE